ncbi:tetratricopeptide repeat protein [Hyalangium gracile]|uniref:tetratricopeptide repeat protein n=1 Tax=Hyalangium gracile TaxID=394092 RepID=UPI001CCD7945|nr:tetratricopeptide repeat protein [Hyalangium gracile]
MLKETSTLRLEAQKESLQKDLQLLQKDLQTLQANIDKQNQRIEDINAATNRFSIALTGFGILITLVVAIAGAAAWYSAGTKAKEAAQDWVRSHETELLEQVKRAQAEVEAKVGIFETAVAQASQHLQSQIDAIKATVDAIGEKAAQVSQRMQTHEDAVKQEAEGAKAQIRAAVAAATPAAPTAEQKSALREEAKRITQKPEADYTFKDWESRALNAYNESDWDTAALFFGNAARSISAPPLGVARSLFGRAIALGLKGHSGEAVASYEEVVRRFGEAAEVPLREQVEVPLKKQVAMALVNKGVTQGQLGRAEKEVASYEEVVRRFGEAAEVPLKEQVAKALVNKGVTQKQLGRTEEAVASYEEVVRRFGEAVEVPLKEPVATALFNKGVAQGQLGRAEEAVASYEEVVRRFGEAAEVPLKEQVAMALVNKGVTQGQLGRAEEAVASYEEVVRRFGEAAEVPLKKLVAIALNSLGFDLLLKTKRSWSDSGSRKRDLGLAEARFLSAHEYASSNSMVMGNLAYVYFLSGRRELVSEMLQRALQAGGEELYNATIQDTKTDSVPEDAEFRAIVEKTWVQLQTQAAKKVVPRPSEEGTGGLPSSE